MVTTHPRMSTPEGAASVYGRALRGMQQADLAEALTAETGQPWTKQKVSRLERGDYRPRSYEVRALAKVLGLPLDFIMEGSSQNSWSGDSPPLEGTVGSPVLVPA